MDAAIILTLIGLVWTTIWRVFTWYVPNKAKKNMESVLAPREEIIAWHFKQEEDRLRRAIINKGFSAFTTFVIFLIPYIILAILGGSGESSTSQAGTDSSGDMSQKLKSKIERFYDEHLPKAPDITINIILGILILFSLPFLLGYLNVGKNLTAVFAGIGGGALITVIARIIKKLYFSK